MEILEFHEMMELMEKETEEVLEPVELSSFEFFIQALSHFEGKAQGKLNSTEKVGLLNSGSRLIRLEFRSQDSKSTRSNPLSCKKTIKDGVNFLMSLQVLVRGHPTFHSGKR